MDKKNLVITIERQYGSGGRVTGKRLAEELGIHFYDEEILKMTSEESAIGEQYFRLADERAGNNLLYKIVGGLRDSLAKPSTKDDITSPDNLFRFQSDVIRNLAKAESCIIAGRCADYVLEDCKNVDLLNVFIYGELSYRVGRVMEAYGITQKQAKDRVVKTDKQRKTYYNYYSNREWGVMSNYDMCLNTGVLGIENSAKIIINYIKGLEK